MRFKIDFTTLPSIEVEMDFEFVEAFATHYCVERGLDTTTGKGPMPLQIQRVPDPLVCRNCGYTEVWLSHNTLTYYCINCDSWIDEDEEKV